MRDRQSQNTSDTVLVKMRNDHSARTVFKALFLSYKKLTTPKIGITDNKTRCGTGQLRAANL
jgi:hypothetical protein